MEVREIEETKKKVLAKDRFFFTGAIARKAFFVTH